MTATIARRAFRSARVAWPLAAALLVLATFATTAAGQVTRLPAIDATHVPSDDEASAASGIPMPALRLGQLPGDGLVVPSAPDQIGEEAEPSSLGRRYLFGEDDGCAPAGPPGARPGVFQRLDAGGFWMPNLSGTNGLGLANANTSVTFAFPFFTRESPLILTPAFGLQFWDAPGSTNIPARTYDAALQVRWLRPITPWLMADVAVSPGYFSDFDVNDGMAIRVPGRALGIVNWSPTVRLVAGVAYLDRQDVNILPAGGVMWTPSERLNAELIFPRPKVAWRISPHPSPRPGWWVYVRGDFGGGAWAFRRDDGAADEITYRDFRVLLGLERLAPGGLGGQFEIGYVFGRRVEYRSDLPSFKPADTLIVQRGLNF